MLTKILEQSFWNAQVQVEPVGPDKDGAKPWYRR